MVVRTALTDEAEEGGRSVGTDRRTGHYTIPVSVFLTLALDLSLLIRTEVTWCHLRSSETQMQMQMALLSPNAAAKPAPFYSQQGFMS